MSAAEHDQREQAGLERRQLDADLRQQVEARQHQHEYRRAAHEIYIHADDEARGKAPIDQYQSDEDSKESAKHDREQRDQDRRAEALQDGPARDPELVEESALLEHVSAGSPIAARRSAAQRRSGSRRRHTSGWPPSKFRPLGRCSR